MAERVLLRDLAPGAWFRTLVTGLAGRVESHLDGWSIVELELRRRLVGGGRWSSVVWGWREVHPNLLVEPVTKDELPTIWRHPRDGASQSVTVSLPPGWRD